MSPWQEESSWVRGPAFADQSLMVRIPAQLVGWFRSSLEELKHEGTKGRVMENAASLDWKRVRQEEADSGVGR